MMNLKRMIKKIIRKALKISGFELPTAEELEISREIQRDNKVILSLSRDEILNLIALSERTRSQLKQDVFVLYELNFKKNGFFVEFGATNGRSLSNTYLLEKEFGWDGILAEPAKHWHAKLRENRSCNIETDCVWIDSKTVLTFNETNMKGFSTIDQYSGSDHHEDTRKGGKKYQVNSISLIDLLDKYNAPKEIDYLSIDTEGSEYDILASFDFDKYSFKVITCEHNYTANRSKIHQLLKEKGYTRKFVGFSKWDDWYIKS